MVASSLAFDILARDRASSTFEKVARSADKTSAALKKSIKINDDVARAETRLSKARDGESDAMGRVKVAEQRLQELRDKGMQGTSRFTAAEESLSSARRKAAQAGNTAVLAERDLSKARTKLAAEAASAGRDGGKSFGKAFSGALDKEGQNSGKRLGAGVKKWFAGDGTKLFGKSGQISGEAFSSGLSGILKTPVVGPAVAAGLVAAVATAAPAAGAIAAAGLVAGFGAGIAGLGLVFAAKSEVVQRTWSKTMGQLGADMRLLSKPFESTLVNIAGYFQRTVDKFNPALSASFAKMAPVVDRFADGLLRSLEQLAPAIAPITNAFGGILDSLGPALHDVVGQLAADLTKLANSVAKSPQALADMTRGIGDLSSRLLGLVTSLNDANSKFRDMTGGTSLVKLAFDGLNSVVGGIVGPLDLVARSISGISDGVNALKHSTDASGKSMSDAANDTVKLAQGLGLAGAGAQHAVAPLQSITDALSRQKLQFSSAIAAMGQWTSRALAGSNAAIAYEASLDAATASLKENGKTLDIGTEKGRANRTALNSIAEAANRQTQAMDDAGKSNVTVAATAEKSRVNFIKLAVQMGATVPQAKAMARSMINIPNVSREAKLKANKADLDAKLASAKKQLADPNLTRERRAHLTAEIKKLQAAVAQARASLASLPGSKTVTIVSRFVTERITRTQTTSGGGHAPGHAAGGLIPGRPSSIDNILHPMATGEFVVRASQASKNLPLLQAINAGRQSASTGRRAAAGHLRQPQSSGELRIVLEVHSDGTSYGDFITREIRKLVHVTGGNVQAAFGGRPW